MRSYSTHALGLGEDLLVSHSGYEYLALVDVASYSAFVSKSADHLDMMVHLDAQARALTILCWDVPKRALRLRFVVTDDDRTADRMGFCYSSIIASGSIRTLDGELCLTGRDRLFDCARHRSHDLMHGRALPRGAYPALLSVPPGVYGVQVCSHWSSARVTGDFGLTNTSRGCDFTVILHHYPFPARRTAPVRLPGLMRWGTDKDPSVNTVASTLHADPTRRWQQL